ncbi:MAG: hypothetical protein EP330_29785 [Deltaproteobacteria bacterium]|nr:MAG: hypothetical protein EP330_29785 [Deltaproteobacteria bacterium]
MPPTEHAYPMAASVHAGWLWLWADSPLVVDWMNLLPAALLFASSALLFRVVSGNDGLLWMPFPFIAMMATPLFQVAILPSTDMWFGATALAWVSGLVATLLERRLGRAELWVLALVAGLCMGSKSLALIYLPLATVAFAGTAWTRGWPRIACSGRDLAVAVVVALAAGAIWPIRAWDLFGSPLAPVGLEVGGVVLFEGKTSAFWSRHHTLWVDLEADAVGTLSRIPGHVAARLGRAWFVPLVVGLGSAAWLGRASSESVRWRRRALAGWALSTLVLELILLRSPWSSLDDYEGTTLRYHVPVIVVGLPILLGQVPVERWSRGVRWGFLVASLVSATSALWLFGRQQALVVELGAPTAVGVVFVVMASAVARRLPGTRWPAHAALLLAFGLVAFRAVERTGEVRVERERQFEAQLQALCTDSELPHVWPGREEHRQAGLLWHLYRSEGDGCAERRVFAVKRYEYGLEMQSPDADAYVLDVAREDTRRAVARLGLVFNPACDVALIRPEDGGAREAAQVLDFDGEPRVIARGARYALLGFDPPRNGCDGHRGPTATIGQELSFAEVLPEGTRLSAGWSPHGKTGVWTVAEEASLTVVLDELPQRDLEVHVRGQGYAETGPQVVDVYAGERRIATLEAPHRRADEFVLRVPRSAVSPVGALRLTFRPRAPVSPISLGRSTDRRLLGFHVESLTVLEVPEETLPAGPPLGWLREGWARPEPHIVWSLGETSHLAVPVEGPGPWRIELRGRGYAAGAEQGIEVWAGERRLAEVSIPVRIDTAFTVDVPANAGRTGEVPLSLRFARPVSPKVLGRSADARVLGFGLVGARVVR